MDIITFEKNLIDLGINITKKWKMEPRDTNYFEFFINKQRCLVSISILENYNTCVFTCNGVLLYGGYSANDCLTAIKIFLIKMNVSEKKI